MRRIIFKHKNGQYSWLIKYNEDQVCYGRFMWDTKEEAKQDFNSALKVIDAVKKKEWKEESDEGNWTW